MLTAFHFFIGSFVQIAYVMEYIQLDFFFQGEPIFPKYHTAKLIAITRILQLKRLVRLTLPIKKLLRIVFLK